MNWKQILNSIKRPRRRARLNHSLDYKLVKNTQPRRLPQWAQLKYIGHFLNGWQKTILVIGIILSITGFLYGSTLIALSQFVTIPTAGGQYSEAMIGQPNYINPLFAVNNEVDSDISSLVYSGLFRYDNKQQLVPELATRFTISEDQKTYEVTIRDDVRWADGQPFSLNDILYTFEAAASPEVGSPLLASFQGVKIERVNDVTIRFTLKKPFAPFLSSLTVGILPEHIWGSIPLGSLRSDKHNLKPLGTGPWQFYQLIKDAGSGKIQTISLIKNDYYYRAHPYLNSLRFQFYDDPLSEVKTYEQALAAVKNQEVDGISFVPPDNKLKLNSGNVTVHSLQLPQYTALFFNQTNAPELQNTVVRQALAKAINKPKLVREALQDAGQTIESPFLPGNLSYYPTIKKINLDIEAGNKLLDDQWERIQPEDYFKITSEALLKNSSTTNKTNATSTTSSPGLATSTKKQIAKNEAEIRKQMNPEQAFYRKDKSGHILELTLTTVDYPEYVKTAQLIKSMWSKLGLKTTIRTISSHQVGREILKNHAYQILLYGEIVAHDPDPFPFWHSSQIDYPGLNLALFANREADTLLEKGRNATSTVERIELYKKFQDILAEELPAIFLYTPTHNFIINNRIKGVIIFNISTPADRYNGLENWYVQTSRKWKS